MRHRKERKTAVIFWGLSLLWIAVVFLLSRQAAADSSVLSGRLTDFVLRLFPQIGLESHALEVILRKIAHGVMFAVEGFLLCMACGFSFGKRAGAALAAGASAMLAVVSELVQTLADGRSCELRDMGIDFAGAVAGIAAALLFMLFIDKLSHVRVTNQR